MFLMEHSFHSFNKYFFQNQTWHVSIAMPFTFAKEGRSVDVELWNLSKNKSIISYLLFLYYMGFLYLFICHVLAVYGLLSGHQQRKSYTHKWAGWIMGNGFICLSTKLCGGFFMHDINHLRLVVTTGTTGPEHREFDRRDPSRWPRDTLYAQKFAFADKRQSLGRYS
jgi:hypothetical protein